MAARVDFYILDSTDPDSRLRMACRLADKAQRHGHRIVVRTEDPDQSLRLDKLMWTFSQSSFVAHAVFDSSDPFLDRHPVLISHQAGPQGRDILVNLDTGHAIVDGDYDRILEVIDQDNTIRELGREKYRTYRKNSFNIDSHHIRH